MLTLETERYDHRVATFDKEHKQLQVGWWQRFRPCRELWCCFLQELVNEQHRARLKALKFVDTELAKHNLNRHVSSPICCSASVLQDTDDTLRWLSCTTRRCRVWTTCCRRRSGPRR